MNKEKTPYSPIGGDYDTEKLTDLHSSNTQPSYYARNIKKSSDKNSNNSTNIGSSNENNMDMTERIPTLIKYSNINNDEEKIDYKGEI